MLADIALGVSVVAAGLWSGLLLMLTTILHPVYATQGPRGFAEAMRAFLPVARTSPTNTVLVALLVLAPAGALVGCATRSPARRSSSRRWGWRRRSPARSWCHGGGRNRTTT